MVSKRQQIVAIVIILLVVPSALILALLINEPESPESNLAQKMILDPEDLGTGWKVYPQDNAYYDFSDTDVNMSCYAVSDLEYDLGVYVIRESLTVFNSTFDCNQGFHIIDSGISSSAYATNYSVAQIGDRGFSYLNGNESSGLVFQKGCVICTYWTYPISHGPSIDEQLRDLSIIQLQKIDQYLPQHPGAN
jgi:hypothetical protein